MTIETRPYGITASKVRLHAYVDGQERKKEQHAKYAVHYSNVSVVVVRVIQYSIGRSVDDVQGC